MTGPGGVITVDGDLGQVNIETELAVVIGRSCRRLTTGTALDAVLGYTIANDVTLADQMPLDDGVHRSGKELIDAEPDRVRTA